MPCITLLLSVLVFSGFAFFQNDRCTLVGGILQRW